MSSMSKISSKARKMEKMETGEQLFFGGSYFFIICFGITKKSITFALLLLKK